MPEVFERKRFEITQEESKKIEYAMEKINALKNLILVAENNPLERNEKLYDRFMEDIVIAQKEYDKEWEHIYKKYGDFEGYQLHLDFHTYVVECIPENETIKHIS